MNFILRIWPYISVEDTARRYVSKGPEEEKD